MKFARYEELVEAVKNLHAGQADYTGRPYWEHCKRVLEIALLLLAERGHDTSGIFQTDEYDNLIVTALFHDVLEDVPDGKEKLSLLLLPEEKGSLERIEAFLTRRKEASYEEYIDKIIRNGDKTALLVKFADMLDHVDRIPFIQDQFIRQRLQAKYEKPMTLLRRVVDQKFSPIS